MRLIKFQHHLFSIVVLASLLSACTSKTIGYRIHTEPHKEADNFALLVQAAPDFAVAILSINGKDTNGVIRSISRIPTYIEIPPGEYHIGVGLKGGTGRCGSITVVNSEPTLLHLKAEAGKVYLVQRSSKFSSKDHCSEYASKINVNFFFTELPALPYEDVRPHFIPIDLDKLKELPKN